MQGRPGQPVADPARIVERVAALHQASDPDDVLRPPLAAGGAQERLHSGPLCLRSAAKRMDQHQRPLALEQVAERFLAVALIGGKIEQIVLDLERGAEEEAEANELVEIGTASGPIIAPTRAG